MKYDIDSINKRKENTKIVKKIIEIIAIILIYNIILIMISSANKISIINIFGYKSYIIKTNSMEPTIKVNDVLITKKVKKENIKTGDVITFIKNDEVITHRITQISENGEYTTKGDNNNIEDTFKVNYENIEGKYIMTIPLLGKIVEILDNKIVFLIITLIILIFMLITIQKQEKRDIRKEKKRKEDEKREIKQY